MASLLVFCSSVQIEHGSPPVCILNCACYNVFWDLLLVSIYGHKNTDSRTDKCMSAITVSLKCHSNCARYRITSVSKFNITHFASYEKISFYQIVTGLYMIKCIQSIATVWMTKETTKHQSYHNELTYCTFVSPWAVVWLDHIWIGCLRQESWLSQKKKINLSWWNKRLTCAAMHKIQKFDM